MNELLNKCVKTYRRELRIYTNQLMKNECTRDILFEDECYLDLQEKLNISIEEVHDIVLNEHNKTIKYEV